MTPIFRARRRLLQSTGAMLATTLCGCTSTLVLFEGGPVTAMPTWRAGDRWVYRTREGFRKGEVWEETRVVQREGPEGIELAVIRTGPQGRSERVEAWQAPGMLLAGALYDGETRRFASPLPRLPFPLTPGRSANVWVDNEDVHTGKRGRSHHHVRVGGWRGIDTAAGRFDAIAIEVLVMLDDEDVWHYPTQCQDLYWFAPAVGQVIREERAAHYVARSRRSGGLTTMHRLTELVAFTRAPA